jgi:hypothetical protein
MRQPGARRKAREGVEGKKRDLRSSGSCQLPKTEKGLAEEML